MEAKMELDRKMLTEQQLEKLNEFKEQKAKELRKLLEKYRDVLKEQVNILVRELIYFKPEDPEAYIKDFFMAFRILQEREQQGNKDEETMSDVQM